MKLESAVFGARVVYDLEDPDGDVHHAHGHIVGLDGTAALVRFDKQRRYLRGADTIAPWQREKLAPGLDLAACEGRLKWISIRNLKRITKIEQKKVDVD